MITPAEFEDQMKEIDMMTDVWMKHVAADSLMCDALKDLGYVAGTRIFENMDKQYGG